ncbi:MAG: FliA/WhiG family RNA polymerase sigma factor [Hyphomonadaceae bacterium]|nr:FliA/WhiG family RNA polymerase sigma factor [Clostridia bacterium]
MAVHEISDDMWSLFKHKHTIEMRNAIVMHYTYLVKGIAGRLAHTYQNHFDFDDLLSCGIFGLMDAIEKFDIDKGVKFETYASWRIKGSIIDQIRKQDWLPKSLRQKFKSIEVAYEIFEKNNGRYPEDSELADSLCVSVEKVREILNESYSYQIISMDEQIMNVMDFDQDSMHHELSPEHSCIEDELKLTLSKVIDKLTDNERMVVSLYYYEELSQKEISKVMRLTESRVSQLHTKALLKLKTHLEKHHYVES